MNVTDEKLMAFADGELTPEIRSEIEREIAGNPVLAEKLNRHRALRAKVSAAFDPVMTERVPDRLQRALSTDPANAVTHLAEARAAKRVANVVGQRRPAPRAWMSIAASISIGIFVGYFAFNLERRPAQFVAADGRISNGALARALAQRTSGIPTDSVIQLGISYVAKSGEYCRSFAMLEQSAFTGIACHSQLAAPDAWTLRMLVPSEKTTSGDFRTAGTALPTAILNLVSAEIDGEPLDAEGESSAVEKGWKR